MSKSPHARERQRGRPACVAQSYTQRRQSPLQQSLPCVVKDNIKRECCRGRVGFGGGKGHHVKKTWRVAPASATKKGGKRVKGGRHRHGRLGPLRQGDKHGKSKTQGGRKPTTGPKTQRDAKATNAGGARPKAHKKERGADTTGRQQGKRQKSGEGRPARRAAWRGARRPDTDDGKRSRETASGFLCVRKKPLMSHALLPHAPAFLRVKKRGMVCCTR